MKMAVNGLISKYATECSPEFVDDWPLTEKELFILDTNHRKLVDLLETSYLLPLLYSEDVVNNRQKDFVLAKTNSHEKNDALLDILRRTSIRNYEKTIDCLHSSKQGHIVRLFKEGGARVETNTQPEFFAIFVSSDKKFVKVNLQQPSDISSVEKYPFKTKFPPVTAVYCNTMYVTGVGDNLDEIWKYNKTSGWAKCASLVQGRRSHSAEFIDEVLYICGGRDDADEKVRISVEAYDAISDKCTIVGKLVHGVLANGICVPFKSSLYIFGDAYNNEFQHVQVYNTKENKCSVLSTPMPHRNCKIRTVLCDKSVFLLGRDVSFIYNIETETWRDRKEFNTDYSCFGLAIESEQVFLIGGEVRSIPLSNILNNKPIEWKFHATI